MAPQTKPIRQATRTLQTLRGTGQVYAEQVLVCEVRYSVTVHQGTSTLAFSRARA